jgi:hypothetical protein
MPSAAKTPMICTVLTGAAALARSVKEFYFQKKKMEKKKFVFFQYVFFAFRVTLTHTPAGHSPST